MEKDEIVSRLKTAHSQFGFSENAFDGVADYLAETEDDKMDAAIAGIAPILKSMQSDSERRVAKFKDGADKWTAHQAALAAEEEAKEKDGEEGKGKEGKNGNGKDSDNAILAAIKELKGEISEIRQGKIIEENSDKVTKTLEEKGIPKVFIETQLKGLDLTSETAKLDAIESVQKTWEEIQKVTNPVKGTKPPAIGGGKTTGVSSLMQQYLKNSQKN